MLYLTGKMGCGKSVLAKFLLETLEQRVSDPPAESDKSAVLYYFCSSVTRPEESASSLVRGLIHQFLSDRKSLYPLLIETCKGLFGSQSSRDLNKWNLRALWDIFVSLLCSSSHEIIWLVIDAMDECQETETKAFLTLLISLLEPGAIKGKTLKIFLTSRPYDLISGTLYYDHIKKIHIHQEMILPDIKEVLGKQLEDIQRQFSLSSTEIQELKGRLAHKSDGMFMWAVLAMKELSRSALYATFGSLEDLINDLPQGLTELYDKAWLKLDRSHDENVDLARKILIWILLAARPLTLSEMNMVLAIWPSKTNETSRLPPQSQLFRNVAHIVLHFFAPFVEIVFRQSGDDLSSDVRVSTVEALRNFGPIDDSIATVRLVHQSAQAYLLQKSTENFSGQLSTKVGFSKEDGHELIARTCIAYLECKELKLEWIGLRRLDDKGLLKADDSTRDLIRKKLHQYVLLEYSSLYWSLHVRRSHVAEKKEQAAQRDFQDDISSHALDFLCNYRMALECTFQVSESKRNPERIDFWPCHSPLHDAAYLDCLAVVQRLLNIENVDINSRDSVGSTPLMHVCMSIVQEDGLDSRVQIASLLLERNADPKVRDNFGKTALHYAVLRGAKMVQMLLEKGAEVGAKDNSGQTALHSAAESGHGAVINLLLEKGSDVAAKDGDGMTPLHFAAKCGHEAVVQLLPEKGADVAAKDDDGITPLHLAAENGHEAVVQLLLRQNSVDLESKDKDGWTPLSFAARGGHEMIIQLLLEKGANAMVKSNKGGTALICAAGNGHKAAVQLLLEKGADIEARNDDGVTALHVAAGFGHKAVVQLLVEKGADIAAKFMFGASVLHAASVGGQEEMVRLLLEKWADIGTKEDYGRTVLHSAAEMGHEAVVKLLLEKGADAGAKDSSGQTALYSAAEMGQEAVVKLLLENGADAGAKDNNGQTALHTAAEMGHEAVVKLLLEKGANIGAKDDSRLIALHCAAWNGHGAVVKLLLEKGADMEARDWCERTTLHLAAQNGQEAVVRLLVEKGADVAAKDNTTRTALRLAIENKHNAIVRLLQSTTHDLVDKNADELDNDEAVSEGQKNPPGQSSQISPVVPQKKRGKVSSGFSRGIESVKRLRNMVASRRSKKDEG